MSLMMMLKGWAVIFMVISLGIGSCFVGFKKLAMLKESRRRRRRQGLINPTSSASADDASASAINDGVKHVCNVAIVVVGDIGRSPRMQNHALAAANWLRTLNGKDINDSCRSSPSTKSAAKGSRTSSDGRSTASGGNNVGRVWLVGMIESRCRQDVQEDSLIELVELRKSWMGEKARKWFGRVPFVGFLTFACLKVTDLAVSLFLTLWRLPDSISVLILQTPPGVPALFVCYLIARLRHARVIVDWHNYGFTLLRAPTASLPKLPAAPPATTNASRVTSSSSSTAWVPPAIPVAPAPIHSQSFGLVAKLYRQLEFSGGRLAANFSLCVSDAMRHDLSVTAGIKTAWTVRDAPTAAFKPLSLPEKHLVFVKYFPIRNFGAGTDGPNTDTTTTTRNGMHTAGTEGDSVSEIDEGNLIHDSGRANAVEAVDKIRSYTCIRRPVMSVDTATVVPDSDKDSIFVADVSRVPLRDTEIANTFLGVGFHTRINGDSAHVSCGRSAVSSSTSKAIPLNTKSTRVETNGVGGKIFVKQTLYTSAEYDSKLKTVTYRMKGRRSGSGERSRYTAGSKTGHSKFDNHRRRGETDGHLNESQSGGQQRRVLAVSGTSWGQDEDFYLLLRTLQQYEEQAETDAQMFGPSARRLPTLDVLITGKGDSKRQWLEAAREALSTAQHVTVRTIFCCADDYPLLLGCADIGICLHTSSSGLDLPMKLVDLIGCRIPAIFCFDYPALHEMIECLGRQIQLFSDDASFTDRLLDTLRGFPEDGCGWRMCEVDALRAHTAATGRAERSSGAYTSSWSEEWNAKVRPMIEVISNDELMMMARRRKNALTWKVSED